MLKLGQKSGEDVENVTELLCEQYMPRVFQYIHYWVNDTHLAEELTIRAIKKALVKYGSCYKRENVFLMGVFVTARKEIQNYGGPDIIKPILPNLSLQEHEVTSLKFGAILNNQRISKILSLPESRVGRIVYESLCKLNGCLEVSK